MASDSGSAPAEPATAQAHGRTFFGHPWPLATLFSTELWERFSYYGMRAILVLYLVAPAAEGGQGWSEGDANALYGVYTGLAYLTALPGGWIADRLIGARRSVLYGGIIIAAGHYCLALPWVPTFFLGLVLIVTGTGLLKPNISAMVGSLYEKDSPRRDAGFSLFYMGINIGGFIAPLIVGYLAQKVDWHAGFACAGIGMTIAVIWYVVGRGNLRGLGEPSHRLSASEKPRLAWWFGGSVAACVLLVVLAGAVGLLTVNNVVLFLTFVPVAVAIVYFWRMLSDRELSDDERSRIKAYVFLFIFAALFWLIYDQAGSVLNVFAERDTDLGWVPAASWLQSLQPIYVIIGAPLAGILWVKLGHRLATPGKFAIGLMLSGLSFTLMGFAAAQAVGGHKVSYLWLVAVYALQVAGELALSPIGLSATTKLAPARYVSQMMGLWFLAAAAGDAIGGQVARLTEVISKSSYFLTLGLSSIVIGLAAFAMRAALRGMMRGIH